VRTWVTPPIAVVYTIHDDSLYQVVFKILQTFWHV